jgi:hypothetical protein
MGMDEVEYSNVTKTESRRASGLGRGAGTGRGRSSPTTSEIMRNYHEKPMVIHHVSQIP